MIVGLVDFPYADFPKLLFSLPLFAICVGRLALGACGASEDREAREACGAHGDREACGARADRGVRVYLFGR